MAQTKSALKTFFAPQSVAQTVSGSGGVLGGKVMGEDYWPYGAHENQRPLETLARYSFQQGLSVRQVAFEEMFAKSTYELTKI